MSLPPIGSVHGPADRRLRVGLLMETIDGAPVDEPTRRAVERTAALLEDAGHHVEPIAWPVTDQFADDFLHYWGLLADLSCTAGKFTFGRSFDGRRTEPLTRGLREHHRRNVLRTPAVLRRLGRAPSQYARMFARHEVVLSPVLGHTVPKLGYIAPDVPYSMLIERLRACVSFTPLQNIAGTPAISLPMGLSDEGVPIGVQLSGAYGDERTLLEVAYALESAQPFVRIADAEELARR